MITNLPSPADFTESGLSLLNHAWDPAISLLLDLDESIFFGVQVDKKERDRFWTAAKQRLATALAIAQQGVEFVLKGRIVAVSPYLLIGRNLKEWPKLCSAKDTNFADFRTIDAQDLVTVYNAVSKERLGGGFIHNFDELRRKRNSITHTIDNRLKLQAIDVLIEILAMHKHLFPQESWIDVRRTFLEESPTSELYSPDWVDGRIIREFSVITEVLNPANMKSFFGFDKKQRRYICPECNYRSGDDEVRPRTALLRPNSPTSTIIYCYVCNEHMKVQRVNCNFDNCKGNVISVEYEICTTCGHAH